MRELARSDPVRPRDRWTRKLDFIVWPRYGTFGRSRWYQVRTRAWDESAHPRVPAGGPDGGQFGEGGGGGSGSDKPSGKGSKGKKGKVKVASVKEFRDDKVEVNSNKVDKFIESWNDAVGMDPGDFKETFLGHLPGTMILQHRYYEHSDGDVMENRISISGDLHNEQGSKIGTYTREIDLKNNKAESAYFALNSGAQGKGEGKTLLAANVEMYQELGLDEVKVHANIDVGGYAWAKYGYVPTEDEWDTLRGTLREKLDSGGGGSEGYEPEEWESMSSDNQDSVFEAWAEASHDEFYDSEVESWRESGQALGDAKRDTAEKFNPESQWANNAVDKWRSERPADAPPVLSNKRILDIVTVEHDGEGRHDPDITIENVDWLTDEDREGIEAALIDAFNGRAEDKANDMDPPDYVEDSIKEQQRDVWDNMSDREKFRYASNQGLIENIEGEGGDYEGPAVDVSEDEKQELYSLLDEDDPKSIWALADSPGGKELLLGSDWTGKLDLHDKDTMTRFEAYVGKAKPSAAKAAA